MILTVVRLLVRPEASDSFPFLMRDFTEGTRAHAGNLWCTWTRNVEAPDEYTLVEAFADARSAREHAMSEYFVEALRVLPAYLQAPPQAIHADLPGHGWVTLMDLPFFAQQGTPATGRFS